jgi:hypothetical protein
MATRTGGVAKEAMSQGVFSVASEAVRLDEVGPEAAKLAAYWEARRLGREMPTRRDLDVLDMRHGLGRISLYEMLTDGDFRCRLRGTTMCTVPLSGHTTGGGLISATQPKVFAEMGLQHYHETYDRMTPVCYRVSLTVDGFTYDYERLSLPLAPGGGLPPMIMTFIPTDLVRARELWRRYAGA